MADITKFIKPVEWAEEIVEHEGEKFTVRGRPDINILSRGVMVMPSVQSNRAEHWSKVVGAKFEKVEVVAQVMLVKETLVDDREGATGEEPRYDETEIASLAATNSMLFLKLLGPAQRVLGINEKEFFGKTEGVTADPAVAAGLGNSTREEEN